MQNIITVVQREKMLENGQVSRDHEGGIDHKPVIKLFIPDTNVAWLLSELYPDDPDIAFGLCDLGMGFPEMGDVRLSEIFGVQNSLGVTVEQDQDFVATKTVSEYAAMAREHGRIVTGEGV